MQNITPERRPHLILSQADFDLAQAPASRKVLVCLWPVLCYWLAYYFCSLPRCDVCCLCARTRSSSPHSREAVRESYERLSRAPSQVAYSADTLFSRAVLLRSAAECLADLQMRRSYDNKVQRGHGEMKVCTCMSGL